VLVVPAKAGTHNHECPGCAKLKLQHAQQRTSVVMGPGLALVALACPGRRQGLSATCTLIVIPNLTRGGEPYVLIDARA